MAEPEHYDDCVHIDTDKLMFPLICECHPDRLDEVVAMFGTAHREWAKDMGVCSAGFASAMLVLSVAMMNAYGDGEDLAEFGVAIESLGAQIQAEVQATTTGLN